MKITSRKLWLFIVLEAKNTLLAMYASMPWEVYGTTATMLFLWYVGGNVGEHLAQRNKGEE